MAWNHTCTRLRGVLMNLYSDVEDAKRLVKDAQLNYPEINFQGKAASFWHSIVEVAEKDRMLVNIIRQARIEHTGNGELLDLEQEIVRLHTQQQATKEVPRLLLYLPDRDEHELGLQESLGVLKHDRNRLIVYILHGDEQQSHDMFLERMKELILPRMLTFGSQEVIVKDYLLRWTDKYINETQLKGWFLRQLAEKMTSRPIINESEMNDLFKNHVGPIMIHLHVMTQDWFTSSPLAPFLRFWNTLPTLNALHPLIICLSIKYQSSTTDRWFTSLFKRNDYQRQNRLIEEEVNRLDSSLYPNLYLSVLPRFENVRRGEVENWARLNELRRWCPLDKLLSEVTLLFTVHETMPMNMLAENLERILLKYSTQ